MLHLTSWMTTLPIMVIGMVSIVLVIGVIVLAVIAFEQAGKPEITAKGCCTVLYSSPCFYLFSPRLSDSRSWRSARCHPARRSRRKEHSDREPFSF